MMEMLNEYIGNRGGIPIVEASQSNAGSATTNAIYVLPPHVFGRGCKGMMIVNFLGASDATVTGVTISVNGSSRELLSSTDTTLTTITTGFHIIVFDKTNNKLNLIV
uniref:Capsid protein n=1 Tax=Geladintestivirus 2 TaxID=3233134 RepID=A0AAU8MIN8_9CAUD